MGRSLRGRRWPGLESALPAGVFLACLIYSLVIAGIGWSNTLLGPHGFRQTQTALSTHSILQGGPWLGYETPVLGAPWAIPFEFPLYQWTVAAVVTLLGTPLDQAGRLVSELFFYATLIPAYVLLASLQVRPRHRVVFLSLLVVSPEYLYWSRSFMMESTALFCGMAYLAFAVRSLQRWRPADLAGAALFGALAAMVKITTFFVFLVAAGLYLLGAWWQTGPARWSGKTVGRVVATALVIVLLPVACGAVWTQFTDILKAHNPLAASFITSAALQQWNLGTAAQRLSGELWLIILNRTLPDIVGHGVVVLASILLMIGERRRLVSFLVCLALFLTAPLAFTNLHMVHNYYAYANGVFLVAAIGWCVVSYLERADRWKWVGVAVLLAAVGASLWRYQRVYIPWQRTNNVRLLDSASVLQGSTTPDAVVLILGLDWSSELPYYARRRALMNREYRSPQDPIMQRALANLGDQRLGAMVVCFGALRQPALIQSWLRATGLSPIARRTAGCVIYTRRVSARRENGARDLNSRVNRCRSSKVPAKFSALEPGRRATWLPLAASLVR